jgi:hypothetical protein
MKTKYQPPVIQLTHKFLENIKKAITIEGCVKENGANYAGM